MDDKRVNLYACIIAGSIILLLVFGVVFYNAAKSKPNKENNHETHFP